MCAKARRKSPIETGGVEHRSCVNTGRVKFSMRSCPNDACVIGKLKTRAFPINNGEQNPKGGSLSAPASKFFNYSERKNLKLSSTDVRQSKNIIGD